MHLPCAVFHGISLRLQLSRSPMSIVSAVRAIKNLEHATQALQGVRSIGGCAGHCAEVCRSVHIVLVQGIAGLAEHWQVCRVQCCSFITGLTGQGMLCTFQKCPYLQHRPQLLDTFTLGGIMAAGQHLLLLSHPILEALAHKQPLHMLHLLCTLPCPCSICSAPQKRTNAQLTCSCRC